MRVLSGVPGFDQLISGGLPKDKLYLLSGPPGSGKTTFSTQFLTQGARNGERGFFISMHETEEELLASMAGYTVDLDAAVEANLLKYLNVFDEQAEQLLTHRFQGDYRTSARNQVRRISAFVEEYDIDRMVFDSTMLLRHFFSDDSDAFLRFLTGLKQADVTCIMISELTDPTSYAPEHYLAHGVIFLHNFLDRDSGSMQRGVQVIKLRGTPIDTDVHPVGFTDAGLTVRRDGTSAN